MIAALAVTPASVITVGQWNFEESTAGNPVYCGDVALGAGNTSLALDGNGDYVSIAHSASLNTTSAFTVEFRMKAGVAGNSGLRLLVDKSHGFIDSTGWTFQTVNGFVHLNTGCLLYTSPSPRDRTRSRMPSSA